MRLLLGSLVSSYTEPVAAVGARIVGFEAEHLSLLEPERHNRYWTAPVLDGNENASYLFAWRSVVEASTTTGGITARNVTQASAVIMLMAIDRATPPVICRAEAAAMSLLCGDGTVWGVTATR